MTKDNQIRTFVATVGWPYYTSLYFLVVYKHLSTDFLSFNEMFNIFDKSFGTLQKSYKAIILRIKQSIFYTRYTELILFSSIFLHNRLWVFKKGELFDYRQIEGKAKKIPTNVIWTCYS